ncbi:pentapeptide repeat-containing protein [Syntrophobacter fumaroxidans]|uniref:Pentapeptide repeat protein n=1 Tax=Syntrophobacter fumaroxidans (strain DSM 10017 / MPOB) TaxID=335543 RepID=A0LF15_SYNFM|nr:pentapeptide repeat-containing protein [Syntrophobacter fumaroxidans]ABK16017.1 pentapeptide repeat protein [Syntrophobacter fumaroxidans MPOB]
MPEITRKQLLMAVISGRGPAYLRGVDLSNLDLSSAGWLAEADLRNADLSSANLSRSNLRNANLQQANMQNCNMAIANLEGAILQSARINVANLRAVNLAGANLREATLVGTTLVKANLKEANLESADLEGANLQGANLWKAKLSQANLRMTNLRGANLSEAYLEGKLVDHYETPPKNPSQYQGFVGSVGGIQLTDLIQIVCLSRSNLMFKIESESGCGTIHVGSGRVYHAQLDRLDGEDALFKMLAWEGGRFETVTLEEVGASTINKPVENLIIEAMRRRDESMPAFMRGKHGSMLREIRRYLPIPAYPSRELMKLTVAEGKNIRPTQEVQIIDAFASTDTGEILCSIVAEEDVFIAPLRFIRIKRNHPLFDLTVNYHKEMKKT